MAEQRSYAEDQFEKVDPAKLLELRRPNYFKGIGLLVLDWVVILAAIAVCCLYFNPLTYVFAWLVIGGRMMGLWTLLHDGHHHLLLPNRKVNRLLTQLFIAWPLFRSLKEYDRSHGDHHRYLGSEKDPNVQMLRYEEFKFPMSRSKFSGILIMDLLGVNFIRYTVLKRVILPIRRMFKKETGLAEELKSVYNEVSVAMSVYWIFILLTVNYFGAIQEFVLFWVIPSVTWFRMMFRLTTVSDHCFTEELPTHRTRSVLVNWFEKAFMVPHNLNYHIEHHTYGGVPCYNLRALHDHLMKHDWFRSNAKIVTGYREVFRILTAEKVNAQK